MQKQDYLKLLVENIHSTTIATIGADGHPQTRVIDMMLYDEQGVYFLTALNQYRYFVSLTDINFDILPSVRRLGYHIGKS